MNMKVSKRDLSILLIVFGLIVAFCVYQFYFRGAMDQKKTYEEENNSLAQRIEKFNGVKEDEIIAEMADNAEKLKKKAAIYPATYLYEDLIMYLYNWQELPYEEMYNFPQYTITETTMTDMVGGVIDWDQTQRTPISSNYLFGKAEINAAYKTSSFKAFKDMINKIYLDKSPKTIKSITAYMEKDTGYIVGNIMVDFYNANSQDGTNVYVPVQIKDVDTGVVNLFGPTYTPTPTVTPTPDPRQDNKANQNNNQDEEE